MTNSGLLSEETYLDSTLLAAHASTDGLKPTSADPKAFVQAVVEANGLFLGPSGPEPDAPTRAYQDGKGRLPLPSSDPDARWGKGSRGRAMLSYKLSVLSDDNGFILGHRLDHANVSDHKAGMSLLATLPAPAVLGADKGYSAGEFRRQVREQGTRAYIPLPQGHPPRFLEEEGFRFNPFALICPEGQSLRASLKSHRRIDYRAQRRLCGDCSRLSTCPAARRHGFTLGEDTAELVSAVRLNRTPGYRRAMRRRRSVAEGNMASVKRLGLGRLRHRGMNKVGIMAALSVLAHNLLRLLRLTGGRLTRSPLIYHLAAVTLRLWRLRTTWFFNKPRRLVRTKWFQRTSDQEEAWNQRTQDCYNRV